MSLKVSCPHKSDSEVLAPISVASRTGPRRFPQGTANTLLTTLAAADWSSGSDPAARTAALDCLALLVQHSHVGDGR